MILFFKYEGVVECDRVVCEIVCENCYGMVEIGVMEDGGLLCKVMDFCIVVDIEDFLFGVDVDEKLMDVIW